MFRVVPDQLKISDGWVRCGHCADVFDATLHLETWVPPATAPDLARPRIPAPPPPPAMPPGAPSDTDGAGVDVELPEAPSTLRTDRFIRREQRTQVGVATGVSGDATPTKAGVVQRRSLTEPSAARPPANGLRAEDPVKLPASGGDPFDVTMPAPLEGEPVKTAERMLPPSAGAAPRSVPGSPPRRGPTSTMVGPSDPPVSSGAVQDNPGVGEADFLTELQRFAAKASGEEPKADSEQPDFRLKRSMVKARGQEAPPDAPPSPAPSQSPSTDVGETIVSPAVAKDPVPPGAVEVEAEKKEEAEAEEVEPPPPAEPEFIQQARRRAYWQTPGMRALLAGAVLLLASLLVSQWALFERNRLVAWKPGLQPTFQALCGALGCTLAPVQRIDAIVIDSTALVRRLGNFYSFDLVLKNTAPISVATPALELSLTDAGDNVISRRVFLPKDLPAVPELLAAGSSLSVSLRLSIAVGDSLPMAGYRALVFYP